MSNGFACPNPSCTYVFSPGAVKGAAALVCPRCGGTFQFRPAAKQRAPLPDNPPKAPAPAVPIAPIVEPVVEQADVQPIPMQGPPSPLVRRLPQRQRPILQNAAAYVVLLLAVGIAAFGAVWLLKHAGSDEDSTGKITSAFNFEYLYPSKEWQQDKKVRASLGANFVLGRAAPNAWVAVFAHDYKTRSPRHSELQDQLIKWLDRYFQGLEYMPQPDDSLDGEPARRIEFQGEADNVLMAGECLMLSRRGYGYWLMTWTPAERRDMAAEEWPSVLAGFHFLSGRDGWQERKPEQVVATGEKAPYRLAYTKGVWEKQSLDGHDPHADLLLRGFDPKESKESRVASTAGTFTVLKLPRVEGDLKNASKTARDYYLARQKEGGYPDTRLEVVSDKSGPADGPIDIGLAPGHLTRLRVVNTQSRVVYAELATVALPDAMLVLQAESLWPRRDFWRPEFAQLRATFRLSEAK
jgi:hypothetical protein